MIKPIVDVIFGGQYGSEGKRLFNEFYFSQYRPDTVVSNFGPNSGGFTSDGTKWATFPMNAKNARVLLSPGSIISLDDFEKEKQNLDPSVDIYVHENACVVLPEHLNTEKEFVRVGSTMTGTMAAVVQKMARETSEKTNTAKHFLDKKYLVTTKEWVDLIYSSKRIQVCTPQGHSLSLNFGFHPYCTSRNTSPQQGLADAGIPAQWVHRVIACMRTYPIRVSNRYDEEGNMVGWSGPCYDDQKETTWENLGLKPEMTSVSKKVRRVFTFSLLQYIESVKMNGVSDVFLNFMNYLSEKEQQGLMASINRAAPGSVTWLGYGPRMSDIGKLTPALRTHDEERGPTMFKL